MCVEVSVCICVPGHMCVPVHGGEGYTPVSELCLWSLLSAHLPYSKIGEAAAEQNAENSHSRYTATIVFPSNFYTEGLFPGSVNLDRCEEGDEVMLGGGLGQAMSDFFVCRKSTHVPAIFGLLSIEYMKWLLKNHL